MESAFIILYERLILYLMLQDKKSSHLILEDNTLGSHPLTWPEKWCIVRDYRIHIPCNWYCMQY